MGLITTSSWRNTLTNGQFFCNKNITHKCMIQLEFPYTLEKYYLNGINSPAAETVSSSIFYSNINSVTHATVHGPWFLKSPSRFPLVSVQNVWVTPVHLVQSSPRDKNHTCAYETCQHETQLTKTKHHHRCRYQKQQHESWLQGPRHQHAMQKTQCRNCLLLLVNG